MPRSRAAEAYDRKSSVTYRSGAKVYFFTSLRISFRAACLLRFRLDRHIENLALGVDGAPEVNHAPIDFQIDFIKMPSRMRFWTALAQTRGDHRPEVVHPAAHGLARDRDPPLREQILDVTKASCAGVTKPRIGRHGVWRLSPSSSA